jgi:hypothetical protein
MAKNPSHTAFNLKLQDYNAKCSSVSVRRSEPKNQDPFQATDLTISLIGIAPDDLALCDLAKQAFPKRNDQQANIEEVTDGKKPPNVQAINGTFKPSGEDWAGYDVIFTPVKPPPATEPPKDEQGELDLPKPEPVEIDVEPFQLRPTAIDLKEITRSATSTEMEPLVDLKMTLKGLPPAEAGRVKPLPWLLLEHLKVRIVPQAG